MFNYIIWQGRDLNAEGYLCGTLGNTLTLFNAFYGCGVGLFMYTETYTL